MKHSISSLPADASALAVVTVDQDVVAGTGRAGRSQTRRLLTMRGDRRRALLHNRRIVDAAGIEGVVVQLGDGILSASALRSRSHHFQR
jgi:hypothetical protein